MRTFLLAFASAILMAAVCAGDWAGCPEGTKFDGWADVVSIDTPCPNGGVRSNAEYVEGRLPYPVCCAPIGRGRRAAGHQFGGNGAEALSKKTSKKSGTSQSE
ncbi:hypothetical protein AAVH_10030 [Aphelenchoides avenae]|nr:hypothetical protein AAVH_10030 [Aphelenchus avenae]